MSANFLNLNESKIKIVVFGKPSPVTLAPNIRHPARNLGVVLESSFQFDRQVGGVVRNSIFHLRTVAKTKTKICL